ncbi:signal peptidase II [Bifidobacterium sp. BRDM6]|uniref:Lipoprotein signal peptidase n=1 Tax=Bifidobacterium choloepi TaxID=2614131 RepID=A0A6I5NMS4_9BIFI|nr:signal peptidase II [Bifidobacterium choloepi]
MMTRSSGQGRLRARVAVFACIAVVALIVDQLTKYWAERTLSAGQTVVVIPRILSLKLVHNPGASLGMGSGATWLISLIACVACIVLVWLTVKTISMAYTVLFALAFAGAFGNLIDRIAYADGFMNGKVVDFLNYGWSVGNVADVFLTVAGVGIVICVIAGVPFSQKELEREERNFEQSDGLDFHDDPSFDGAASPDFAGDAERDAELAGELGEKRRAGGNSHDSHDSHDSRDANDSRESSRSGNQSSSGQSN